ncbi:hypothetical protein DFH28DRAFT_1191761 [Melampsora americana]|nr:hypothetical protein DFH28DRAFT_1191761 [Melampsora americana]
MDRFQATYGPSSWRVDKAANGRPNGPSWADLWARPGLEACRKFVEPIGAWFAQVGRLHQVHHMWQYPYLQARLKKREQAWQVDTWSKLYLIPSSCDSMDANVLLPNSFSPLR